MRRFIKRAILPIALLALSGAVVEGVKLKQKEFVSKVGLKDKKLEEKIVAFLTAPKLSVGNEVISLDTIRNKIKDYSIDHEFYQNNIDKVTGKLFISPKFRNQIIAEANNTKVTTIRNKQRLQTLITKLGIENLSNNGRSSSVILSIPENIFGKRCVLYLKSKDSRTLDNSYKPYSQWNLLRTFYFNVIFYDEVRKMYQLIAWSIRPSWMIDMRKNEDEVLTDNNTAVYAPYVVVDDKNSFFADDPKGKKILRRLAVDMFDGNPYAMQFFRDMTILFFTVGVWNPMLNNNVVIKKAGPMWFGKVIDQKSPGQTSSPFAKIKDGKRYMTLPYEDDALDKNTLHRNGMTGFKQIFEFITNKKCKQVTDDFAGEMSAFAKRKPEDTNIFQFQIMIKKFKGKKKLIEFLKQ
jgi:hypothetical protein